MLIFGSRQLPSMPRGVRNSFMQVAGTRAGDRRVGHVDVTRPWRAWQTTSGSPGHPGASSPAPRAGDASCRARRSLQGPVQVAAPDDQQPVQTLGAAPADKRSTTASALGCLDRARNTATPSGRNTSPKARQNLTSRSRSTKRTLERVADSRTPPCPWHAPLVPSRSLLAGREPQYKAFLAAWVASR